jgi:hypothetical protein
MIGTPAPCPIPVRIAVSGFIGVVASVLLVLAHGPHGDPSLLRVPLFGGALRVLALATLLLQFALILAGPLIVVAIVCGLLLKRSIERNLLRWSLAAPIIVWLFACGMFASIPSSPAAAAQGFLNRFAAAILAMDNLLFLFGACVSGVAFYFLSIFGNRRAA